MKPGLWNCPVVPWGVEPRSLDRLHCLCRSLSVEQLGLGRRQMLSLPQSHPVSLVGCFYSTLQCVLNEVFRLGPGLLCCFWKTDFAFYSGSCDSSWWA